MNINQACILPLVGWLFLAYPTLGALPLASSAAKSAAKSAVTTLVDHTEEFRSLDNSFSGSIDSELRRSFPSNHGESMTTETQIIPHPEREAVADRGLNDLNLSPAEQARRAQVAAKDILETNRPPIRLPKKGFWSRLKDFIMRPWRRYIDWKLKKAIKTLLIKRPEWLSTLARDKGSYFGMVIKFDRARLTAKADREIKNAAAFLYKHEPSLLSNSHQFTEYMNNLYGRKFVKALATQVPPE